MLSAPIVGIYGTVYKLNTSYLIAFDWSSFGDEHGMTALNYFTYTLEASVKRK
jgi:hypothetical protein